MNSACYYKPILKCSEQMEDGRMILYDPATENTHVLNATAAKIYQLCINTEPEDIVLSIVAEGTDVDKEEVLTDIRNTIQNFLGLGILVKI